MSISAITGYTTANSSSASQAVSGSGVQQSSAAESNANRVIDTDSVTVLSLNQSLSSQPDNTQADLLAQAWPTAIETATTIDPLTGQRELLAGAGNNLANTVTNLLTQNGFSADDAQTATAELSKELAQGGQALLSLNQGSTVTNSESVALANGTGSATGTQILSSSFSARFTIGVDLATGQVAVGSQTQSATSESVTTAQTGSAVGASLQSFLDGDQGGLVAATQFNLAVSTDSSVTAPSSPQNETPLQQLIQGLLTPTVSNQGTAEGNIRHLAQIAQSVKTGAPPPAAAPGITIQPNGQASTTVDVTTPAAIRQTDRNGYGSTLYSRLDGTLGTFTLKPTRLTA
ncbi:MAG: hypothetical protein WDN69_25480 [Aliidongia sp.]